MENTNNITTVISNETKEIKIKKPTSEAQLRAAKKFYEKTSILRNIKNCHQKRQRNIMKKLRIQKNINKKIESTQKSNIKKIKNFFCKS